MYICLEFGLSVHKMLDMLCWISSVSLPSLAFEDLSSFQV